MMKGSPPHTWRILVKLAAKAVSAGITSTYVENTMINVIFKFVAWDHLHIRGEYEMRER